MKKQFVFFLMMCLVGMMDAQTMALPSAKKRAVYGVDYYVSPSKLDYSSVARDIVGDAETDYEKAQRIYGWICKTINYDSKGNLRTADACWTKRKAVCQGYCELFYRLGETQGLQMRIIYGLGKKASGIAYEEHSWMSVVADGREILIDPTWGAGYMANGKYVKHSDPMIWFDVKPEWFAFTHYPKKEKSQMLETPISRAQFDRLPYVTPLVGRLGLNPAKALNDAIENGKELPSVNIKNAAFLNKIEVKKVPRNYNIKVGKSYTFCVDKIQPNCLISLQLDDEIIDEKQWEMDGNTLSITFTPKHTGNLDLVVSVKGDFFDLKMPVVSWFVLK